MQGVGDVQSFGQPFSMRVWLDASKLAKYNLTPADISAAIQEQNLRIPGGSVGGPPQESSQAFQFSVVLDADLNTEEQFKNIIIKTGDDGSVVYLKDVARIELGEFSYSVRAKINGKVSSMMAISQTPGGNAVITSDGIMKAFEQLKKSFPPDVDYVIGYETVSIVKISIKEVITTSLKVVVDSLSLMLTVADSTTLKV